MADYYAGYSDECLDQGPYASREAAIEQARRKEPKAIVFTGVKVDHQRGGKFAPDANSFIDDACERAAEEAGEAADGWLEGLTDAQIGALDGQLRSTFATWLQRMRQTPTFFGVMDVQKHDPAEQKSGRERPD